VSGGPVGIGDGDGNEDVGGADVADGVAPFSGDSPSVAGFVAGFANRLTLHAANVSSIINTKIIARIFVVVFIFLFTYL